MISCYHEAFRKINCFPDVTEKNNVNKISVTTRLKTKLIFFSQNSSSRSLQIQNHLSAFRSGSMLSMFLQRNVNFLLTVNCLLSVRLKED